MANRTLESGTVSAIHRRIEAARSSREETKRCIRDGRALAAEHDPRRREQWLQRHTGATAEAVKRFVEREPGAGEQMRSAFGSAAEIIIGENDLVPACFLASGLAAKQAIARVVDRRGQPWGTGFLVAPGLFLTNQHVLHDAAEAGDALIEFDYELMGGGKPSSVTRFVLNPELLFVSSNEGDLDYALVAVGDRVDGVGELGSFGYCPLSARDDKHVRSAFVNVAGHPDGDYKKLSLRNNRITHRDDRVLLYEADTMPGSSGSPAFNDFWDVIALHHYGAPSRPTIDAGTASDGEQVNEGIRISRIFADLQMKLAAVRSEQGRARLREALSLDQRPTPAPRGSTENPRPLRHAGSSKVPPNPLDVRPVSGRDGAIEVPIELVVRIAANGGGAVVTTKSPEARPRPDPDRPRRHAYDPAFLGDAAVPLPRVPRGRVARVHGDGHGADGVLDYEHFSIVMNRDRRLAYFTAVNIDGPTWIGLSRESIEPRESAEGGERWWVDERVDPDEQLDQDFFSGNSKYFDRGHLVRRQDPTWGEDEDATLAEADTFHFTNCSPQHWRFNQTVNYWHGIETWLLERGAVSNKQRVSVFAGPIFAADDPTYGDLQVPRQYWKIVARVVDGRLRATGFVVDQDAILSEPRPGREGWPGTAAVKEWLYAISEIERLTGLDFGPLAANDTFVPGRGEGATRAYRREIQSWSDVPAA